MLAYTFEGAVEIGKPKNMTDEECSGLPIFQGYSERTEDPPRFVFAGVTHNGDVDGPPYPFTLSYWMPSREDLQAMSQGRGIWVRFLSHTVYPMALFTLNEAGEINQ